LRRQAKEHWSQEIIAPKLPFPGAERGDGSIIVTGFLFPVLAALKMSLAIDLGDTRRSCV
jgi:hypothetical protein